MRWLRHQCELGGDTRTLRCLVGWLRRKLLLKFPNQTSYRTHVLIAVYIKSQFDIYLTSS
jgi:hypothetical protein